MSQPFDDPNVERAFSSFPDEVKNGLLHLSRLIFDVEARTGVLDVSKKRLNEASQPI